jgi:hypothetical protein
VATTRYRRETKSSHTAINKHDFHLLIGQICFALECADSGRFDSCKARISSQNALVRLADGLTLRIQISRMEPSTAAAPAVPLDILLRNIQEHCFSERTVRVLEREPGFKELCYRSHQIYFVHDFALRSLGQELSLRQLSRAFECDAGRVKAALKNGFSDPETRGRHSALDDASEREIVDWIQKQAEKFNPVTRTDLLHYCQEKFSSPVSRGWVNSFISRHLDELSEVKSTPQENPRLEVPRVFLDETIRCLQDYVHGMKAELVFNLDEVGMSEWEDRKPKKVVVPITMIGQPIHHGASRSVRHISLIACVSAAGESLTPFIVTSQMSDNIVKRLMSRGVRLGVDFQLRQRAKPYVSRKLFLEYIKTIFLPYLNELRDTEQFEGCEAVLLMDNCSPHISEEVVAVLTEARVRIITFAPHTTQIFQVLDLVLFGALKKHANGLKAFEEEQPTVAFLLKVYHDFKQTMIEVNIWKAFEAIGFTYDIEQIPYGLLFDPEKLRQSPGFVELWERNTPSESLSRRRQNAKFGWINKP